MWLLGCADYNSTTPVDPNIDTSKIFNGAGVHASILSLSSPNDPFTNAAGGDFTLNNTAGRGALLRAAGYYPIAGGSQIGYPDIGAYQHQDSGGGGGGVFNIIGSDLIHA
jgi:hypothetical protein